MRQTSENAMNAIMDTLNASRCTVLLAIIFLWIMSGSMSSAQRLDLVALGVASSMVCMMIMYELHADAFESELLLLRGPVSLNSLSTTVCSAEVESNESDLLMEKCSTWLQLHASSCVSLVSVRSWGHVRIKSEF